MKEIRVFNPLGSVNKKLFPLRLNLMGSIQNPVGPPDPFDKLRIERIEEEERTKGERPKNGDEGPPKEQLAIAAFLLQMLRKAIDALLEKSSPSQREEKGVKENLVLLKTSFETLKREDRSQDAPFLGQLSKIWRHSLEDSIHFKSEEVASKFKLLVKKIQHYPNNERYTFGYYLAENSAQKWVPFPYMELIRIIHMEYRKNPASSPLAEWTLLLDEIISLL